MVKRVLIGAVALLVVIQVVRPRPNVASQPPGRDDFIVRYSPPGEVREMLQRACYDCHSNTTRYPWYSQLQPVGWYLAHHVNEGKHALNLSEFGSYSIQRQAKKLDHMADELSDHSMPLTSYTWIHRDARLTEQQINTLTAWIDGLHDRLAPSP